MLGKAQLAFLKVRPDSMSLLHLSLMCAVFRLPADGGASRRSDATSASGIALDEGAPVVIGLEL